MPLTLPFEVCHDLNSVFPYQKALSTQLWEADGQCCTMLPLQGLESSHSFPSHGRGEEPESQTPNAALHSSLPGLPRAHPSLALVLPPPGVSLNKALRFDWVEENEEFCVETSGFSVGGWHIAYHTKVRNHIYCSAHFCLCTLPPVACGLWKVDHERKQALG